MGSVNVSCYQELAPDTNAVCTLLLETKNRPDLFSSCAYTVDVYCCGEAPADGGSSGD